MIRTCPMRLNKHFKRVYYKGKSVAGGYLVLYYLKNRTDENCLGITVSKKIGKAVVRNHIRRLVKENYRLNEEQFAAGYDLIFVARSKAADAEFSMIRKDMLYLMRKAGLTV